MPRAWQLRDKRVNALRGRDGDVSNERESGVEVPVGRGIPSAVSELMISEGGTGTV